MGPKNPESRRILIDATIPKKLYLGGGGGLYSPMRE